MFPTEIPTEIAVLIIAYLPLSSIAVLRRLNHEWYDFVGQNENTIYRNAAFFEAYIPSPTILLESLTPTGLYSRRVTEGVNDWKEFCKRRKKIGRSWSGLAPSCVLSSPRILPSSPLSNLPENDGLGRVHRIKVDEQVGIIITTTEVGGLVVRDVETDVILWELPKWYVHSYAHLEYEGGYMIFDRNDGNKEVWRRTVDVEAESPIPHPLPDDRQMDVANKTPPPMPAQKHAQFSPYTVLQMPETTRAFRFVYPTLAVVSLKRVFLWDVPSGALIQTIEEIQTVLPIKISPQDSEGNTESSSPLLDPMHTGLAEPGGVPSPNPADIANNEDDEEQTTADDSEDDDSEDDGDGDDESYYHDMPRALGHVRYVDISARHVFLAGRFLLRVFSRATGKCVLDIPSTRMRYGACKWEVGSRRGLSRLALGETSARALQNDPDSYEAAQKDGREVVRMPTHFTYQEYRTTGPMIIDQYVAVHVSRDGKHLVGMLNGSRLVIMHHFEDILNRHNILKGSARRRSRRKLRQETKQAEDERVRDLFDHTLDVQLGSPQASSSIYLAYEHGRVGVVTSNAVYIVTPTVPPPPTVPLTSAFVPNLTICRLPYFSSVSWLAAISCLMLSDTGLYLNWNPTTPHNQESQNSCDLEYESSLQAYEDYEKHRYHELQNGDMFVRATPMPLEVSEVSTVYCVNFARPEEAS